MFFFLCRPCSLASSGLAAISALGFYLREKLMLTGIFGSRTPPVSLDGDEVAFLHLVQAAELEMLLNATFLQKEQL